jgi:alpha-tubulin suppressor-like RCC1 family protein
MKGVKRAVLPAFAVIAVTAAAGAAQAAPTAPATRSAAAPAFWSWGAGNQGELGDGSYAASILPVAVKLPSGVTVTGVAGAYQHALAVTSTGGVLAWGHNSKGELGDGNQTSTKVPVPAAIPAGVKVTAVQGGCSASLALTSTGQLLAWGQNPFGELGDGTTTPSDVPVSVTLPPHVTITQISSGCETNLALTSTGRVLQWGRRLGDSLSRGSSVGHVPVFVRLPAKVTITSIAAGPGEAYAVSSTGQVYAWSAGRPSLVPRPPESQFGTITQIAASYSYNLGLTSRGIVFTWNGSSLLAPFRILIPPNLKVTAIAIGAGSTAYALTSNGQLYAWGSDQDGALGDGGGPDINVPLRVEIPAGLTPTAIAAGADSPVPFAFALTRPQPG